ncbi:MAG: hypothetical protein Q7S67_04200 [Telluria sp.]|nr:hypothetical protein [Telluria sp.]
MSRNGVRETRLPEDSSPPPTRTEIITSFAAMGGGIGASLALESGAVTGAALVPTIAAGLGGVGASGIIAWEIGGMINDIGFVRDSLQSMVDYLFGGSAPLNNPNSIWLTPIPDVSNWKSKNGTDEEMGWYVYEEGDAAVCVVNDWWKDDLVDPDGGTAHAGIICFATSDGLIGLQQNGQLMALFGI